MKFSLIICGYNEAENLDMCIRSCLEQNYPKDDYEIIYVDNNSRDKSREVASKYPIKVFSESKQGLSEARNCGIKNSQGEILVFLDADLKLDVDYLKNHVETFRNSNVGAGGGKVLPLTSTWVSNYLGVSILEGYPRFRNSIFVKTYPGCNLTIPRFVLNKVGFFTENLSTTKGITRFFEDKEICQRIRDADYQILYNPNALVYHDNPHTFKQILEIWWKGARSRKEMIRRKNDNALSIVFRFHLPILYTCCTIILLLITPLPLGLFLLFIACSIVLWLCIRSVERTGLFFESIFIKPWMDAFSLLIVDLAVIYFSLT